MTLIQAGVIVLAVALLGALPAAAWLGFQNRRDRAEDKQLRFTGTWPEPDNYEGRHSTEGPTGVLNVGHFAEVFKDVRDD